MVFYSPMSKLLSEAQDFIEAIKKFQSTDRPEANLDNAFFPREIVKPTKAVFGTLVPNDFRREAITFIETFYFRNKRLPALPDFKNNFETKLLPKLSEWDDFLLEIEPALAARGLPTYDTPASYLEPNFVLAVNLIVNPYDRRPVAAKLKEAGLTTKQWTGLLRQEKNQEYYKLRLDQIFDEDLQSEAKLALGRLIQMNDLQAIKHYHELQNIYRPHEQNNVILILQVIMEILTLHVSPEIIGKVAESLRDSPQLKAINVSSSS